MSTAKTQVKVDYDPQQHEADQNTAFALYAAASHLNELIRNAHAAGLRVELDSFTLHDMGDRFETPQVRVTAERSWLLTGRHPDEQEPVG